ncbi:M24 family peptidase-like protein [Fictibacillus macauensis ZFHKF-1]|uniref:M24 family peptidase-like protein n=1 Tax=Fictibacillus macauensis ZFHKF-1 TaxID=1196324 RepID=I8AE81_9BACL|nr:M24 family metallopeptidase [Fictibacillus macauensis]EIT83897.1 M24 family peptidase-like protein [Fictibacillus macauensis ZFHKF-1]
MSIEKVRQLLHEEQLDGLLLRKRQNFSWITGGSQNEIVLTSPIGVADVLVFPDTITIVTTKQEERRILEEELVSFPYEVNIVAVDWFTPTEPVIHELCLGKEMGSDDFFPPFRLMSEELSRIRAVLTAKERERYRRLCLETAQIVEEVCYALMPGQSEHDIASMIGQRALSCGMNVQVLLVATDERIYKYRHPLPTNKTLEKHALLVLCAERGGLVANVTRVVHFGPLPALLQEHKEKLARIDTAFVATTVPGKTIGEVFLQGIGQYDEEGHKEDWRLLHQGGQTGFDSRELIADKETTRVIEEHMVFTWNPSLPGVKSEDTLLVTKNGNEVLTDTNKWPRIQTVWDGNVFYRPDILIR